jgi:hypothetical protein
MTVAAHRRHDISAHAWELLEPRLPGREGAWGGKARDNRPFINAVFGFCAQERLGAISRQMMATGRIRIDAFAGGATGAYGKAYWKR